VLAVLDRVHSPGRAVAAAREARSAGLDHLNLDLIYGTPESDDDLMRLVDERLSAGGFISFNLLRITQQSAKT
jgi:coproporphyrinogen III oxidase-like Fe-S oxidoreductase